jgi:GTP cyclohydrolase FolE2
MLSHLIGVAHIDDATRVYIAVNTPQNSACPCAAAAGRTRYLPTAWNAKGNH